MMQPEDYHILLVDDEEGIRYILGRLLEKEGFNVDVAAGCDEALASLQAASYDLAFVDIKLAGESGIDLLRDFKALSPSTMVVMFTGCPQVESAAEAVRLGAFDYITKPVRYETLIAVTRHALSIKALSDERERNRANLDAIFRTVTDSIVMIDLEGRLVQFNAAAERICGYTTDQVGINTADIALGCSGGCHKALLEVLRSNAPRELRRIECHTPSGGTRIVSLTATPVTRSDGTMNGAMAVIREKPSLLSLNVHFKGAESTTISSALPKQCNGSTA